MDSNLIFNIQVFGNLIVFGFVALLYVWPRLNGLPLADALTPLLVLHATRTVGLTVLAPNIVDPTLPQSFAQPAAYGDLLSAILAGVSILALRRGARLAPALVWIFSVIGIGDLANAIVQGIAVGLPEYELGPTWFIFTALVPALLVTHAVVVVRLVQHARAGGGVLRARSGASTTSRTASGLA